MKLDTSSVISAKSLIFYEQNFKYSPIESTNIKLKGYSGTSIIPVGLIKVKVKFNMEEYTLNSYVIDNGRPPLFGREWMEPLKINIIIYIYYYIIIT